jgi:outer membrane murein-binding lipoprotein Lpp
MKLNHALLAAVALGAVIAPGAQAATKKHAKHHAPAAKEGALKSEVEELRAQVAALREEIRAQHDSTAATQTQVATLQTQTTTAAQTASAAEQTASSAAAKADTAVAKADAVKTAEVNTDKKVGMMAWAGDTKVGGTVFFNYSNVNQQSNGVKQPTNGTGLNVKRVYITVDHKFSDIFSGNITTDVSNVVGQTTNSNFYAAATGNVGATTYSEVGKGFFIKKVYLQAKFDPAFIVRAGSSDTAWIPWIENIYGHRYIENVLIDEYKLGTSADYGVSVSGDLADGLVSYQVGVVNGAGYRAVQVTKSVDFDGRLSAKYKGFFAGVGGYTGKLGKNVEQGAVIDHTASRIDAGGGFKNDMFTIGGEYAYAKNFNSVTSVNEDHTSGWSGFGNFNVTPQWQVFGRYDWIRQTNITTATGARNGERNRYFNVGLQWEPAKLVDLSLVYKRASLANFANATGQLAWQEGAGTIGGTINGTYDEVGLFGLFKF